MSLDRRLDRIEQAVGASEVPSYVQFSRYYDDPIAFFREVLGIEPWSRQAEILRAVADHDRVAVRSGHKVSKTCSVAGLALWWYATRPSARAIITAPTTPQIRDIVWKEVRTLHRHARQPLGGELHNDPANGLRAPDGREIIGRSTDESERMAGFSGENLLFIVDEASGVDETIYEALEGNRAGGAKIVIVGNPTKTSGTFYRAFTTERDQWHALHISSEESPNVVEGRAVVPGLATREWVEERRQAWGETSAKFQVRVRGNFPTYGDNTIIPLALVEAATARWQHLVAPHIGREREMRDLFARLGRLEIGVDVARFGDDETVIQPRRGVVALPVVTIRGADSITVADRVLEVVRDLRRSWWARSAYGIEGKPQEHRVHERAIVKVDVIGIGSGVFDQLRRKHADEVEAVEINVSRTADDAEEYANLRAQLWFALRDWLATGCIAPDPMLEGELCAPTYSFDASGRQKVMSKDDMKKILQRSPDRADALALAIYNAPPRPTMRRTPAPNFWNR